MIPIGEGRASTMIRGYVAEGTMLVVFLVHINVDAIGEPGVVDKDRVFGRVWTAKTRLSLHYLNYAVLGRHVKIFRARSS